MLTIAAPPGSLAEATGRIIAERHDPSVLVRSALVDALPPSRTGQLDELTDDDFEVGFVSPLASLAETLAGLASEHRRIVLIGSTAGLGDWDAALTGAFAAGATGLMRSVALEYMAEGLAINIVAVPSADLSHAANVAKVAAALLQSGGVSGQVIPCDGGENLRLTRARPRPPTLPERSSRA